MFVYPCRLVRVIDGDTVVVNLDLGFHIWMRETARLADVDTPEIFGIHSDLAAGHAARVFVEEWFAGAQRVRCVSRKYDERGKYGRVLGTFYRDEDPVSLNQALIAAGHEK